MCYNSSSPCVGDTVLYGLPDDELVVRDVEATITAIVSGSNVSGTYSGGSFTNKPYSNVKAINTWGYYHDSGGNPCAPGPGGIVRG